MVSELETLGFQELLSVAEVARRGGITAAAEALGLAKSAVSKHVTRLERRLGVKLLERGSRRVALTREGEAMLPRIESLIAEGRQLTEAAGEALDRPQGLVRIAATPEFGGYLARHFFVEVLARHPGLRLAMVPSYAFEDLQDPAFDLAFRVGAVKDDRLVARPLGSFRRIVVASPGYLEKHPIARPADLARNPCLTFSGVRTTTEWKLVAAAGGHRERTVEVGGPVTVRSFAILLELAEAGIGAAFLPAFVAADALRQHKLVRCLENFHSAPATVFLAYRADSARISRVRAVRDLALDRVPRLLD